MSNRKFENMQRVAASDGEQVIGKHLMQKYGHADLAKLDSLQAIDALLVFLDGYQESLDSMLDQEAPF